MRAVCINVLLLSISLLISFEIAGYVLGRMKPDVYDSTDKVINRLSEEDFQKNLPHTSQVTGWKAPANFTHTQKNCHGEMIAYNYDAHGIRIYNGYDESQAEVLLIGDSYTHGDEIADDDTIAANIYQHSNIMAANLGYGGFEPVQAYLYAADQKKYFPKAKVVILGIMYENIRRMTNQWRPILYNWTGIPFGVKPYIEDGVIHPVPATAFDSFDHFISVANEARKNDYWSKPEYGFPYSIGFIKAITSHAFYMDYLQPKQYPHTLPFEYDYRHSPLAEELFHIITEFAQWAKEEQLQPIVFFLPSNKSDTESPDFWIANYQDKLPSDLIVKNLAFSSIDHQQYNLKSNGGCHPSPYGAQQIAMQYIQTLRSLR